LTNVCKYATNIRTENNQMIREIRDAKDAEYVVCKYATNLRTGNIVVY